MNHRQKPPMKLRMRVGYSRWRRGVVFATNTDMSICPKLSRACRVNDSYGSQGQGQALDHRTPNGESLMRPNEGAQVRLFPLSPPTESPPAPGHCPGHCGHCGGGRWAARPLPAVSARWGSFSSAAELRWPEGPLSPGRVEASPQTPSLPLDVPLQGDRLWRGGTFLQAPKQGLSPSKDTIVEGLGRERAWRMPRAEEPELRSLCDGSSPVSTGPAVTQANKVLWFPVFLAAAESAVSLQGTPGDGVLSPGAESAGPTAGLATTQEAPPRRQRLSMCSVLLREVPRGDTVKGICVGGSLEKPLGDS